MRFALCRALGPFCGSTWICLFCHTVSILQRRRAKGGRRSTLYRQPYHDMGISASLSSAAGNFLALPEELNVKGFQTAMDIDAMGVFNMCSQAPGCSSRCDSQSVALALCTELSSPQEARQGHNHQHQCHVPDAVPCGMIGIA